MILKIFLSVHLEVTSIFCGDYSLCFGLKEETLCFVWDLALLVDTQVVAVLISEWQKLLTHVGRSRDLSRRDSLDGELIAAAPEL